MMNYSIVILCIIASIHTVTVVYDFLFPKSNFASTRVGRLHQQLNNVMHLDRISDALLLILAIYALFYIIYLSKMDSITRYIACLTVVFSLLIILFPLVNFWNIILSLVSNNPPFIDNIDRYFPSHKLFEHNFQAIRSEAIGIISEKSIKCAHEILPNIVSSIQKDNKCWKWYMLKLSGVMIGNPQDMPVLYDVLKSCDQVHNAFLSILDGDSEIPPHVGYFKGYLRYHLGLVIPEENGQKAYIVVGNQRYEWSEGEGVMFDDMYYHYVVNPTSKKRIVLFLDVVRNDIPSLMKPLNAVFLWLFNNHPVIKHVYNVQHQSQVS